MINRRKQASSSVSLLQVRQANDDEDAEKKSYYGHYIFKVINFTACAKTSFVNIGILSLVLMLMLAIMPASYPAYEQFEIPIDHIPLGVAEPLIRIQELENMKEGIIPMEIGQRMQKETLEEKRLRLLGNQALIQYGDRLRNLMMQGTFLFQPSEQKASLDNNNNDDAQLAIRKQLYDLAPWLKGDYHHVGWPLSQFPTIHQDPNSKAIVVCAGDKQYAYLDALVYTIRVVHQSPITIHISYKGDTDLSPSSRKTLSDKFGHDQNLNFLDLSQIFDLDAAKLNGWNLRIFGLLAVPEANLAMLDVDVILYQPPEALFQLSSYQQMGAHFFHDRINSEGLWQPRQLLLRLQPQPSQQAQRALTNGQMPFNEHIQEAGVVLINKARRSIGLWAACLLVGRWDIRRFVQRDLVYGDKELYWTAFEAVNEPYTFAKYYPGSIGAVLTNFDEITMSYTAVTSSDMITINDQQNVALCGRIVHFDEAGQPIWSNGGYLTKEDDRDSKKVKSQDGLQPILFIDGGYEFGPAGKPGLNQYWKFHDKMGVNCLYPNSRKIQQVPPDEAKKGAEAVKYYLQIISGA